MTTERKKKAYLEIAKIINTHGVRGDMKAELWCDSPDTIKKIHTLYLSPDGDGALSVTNPRMFGKYLLFRAEGIDTPEDAARYKEHILYAKREDIPKKKNESFIADIIGLPVLDADTGARYGTLSDVTETPANTIYEVKTDTGTVLLPAVKEFIIRIDEETGVYVRPIPGMFTEAHFDDEEDSHAL